MNMDKKMKIFIFLSICITALIILFASTISYIFLIRQTSQSLATSQVHTMSSSLDNAFISYQNLSIALMLDNSVQQYIRKTITTPLEEYENQIKVRQALLNAGNMQANVQFLSVIRDEDNESIYSGTIGLATTAFYEKYEQDFDSARRAGKGTMQINFQSEYSKTSSYSISVYHPLYKTSEVGHALGTLCFSVEEPVLRQIIELQSEIVDMRLFLVDDSGTIVSCTDQAQIGQKAPFSHHLYGEFGTLEENSNFLVYEKVGHWNYYMIGAIPQSSLYREGIQTVIILIFAIVAMVIISLFLGTRLVKHTYRTMDQLVQCMESVSSGKMDIRMDEKISGEDFEKISRGFNQMMYQLNQLMEQVKEEQRQIEQARLNALQSQIKPHFLYNTLDCIHWQAAMDGNKKISHIVKALAAYYRICLSNGLDVISISQELSHVENYLTIQNIRYGDIISCEIRVKKEFLMVQIPKMTLQPLIENSIYHGIKIKEGNSGHIWIDARYDAGNVVFTIKDDGNGMKQAEIQNMNESIFRHDENFGYGVRNVNKRIQLLFGKEYGLLYKKAPKGGLIVEIRLPGQQK